MLKKILAGGFSDNFRENSQIVSKINILLNKGYITDKDSIDFLENQLTHSDPSIRELAARTIVTEVIGQEYMSQRLQSLKVLLPFVPYPDLHNAPSFGQIDLHTHSLLSDGYSTPAAHILDSYEQGLFAVALTDHDILPQFKPYHESYLSAQIVNDYFKDLGVSRDFTFIPGVEFNVMFRGLPVHMLAYLPDYYKCYDELISLPVFQNMLHKLSLTAEAKEKAVWMLLGKLNERFPELAVTKEEVRNAARGNIIRSHITDALFNKYRDYFNSLEITRSKDVWYKWLPHEYKSNKGYTNYLPSIEEISFLLNAANGKIAIPHPNEIFQEERFANKSGTLEGITESLMYLMKTKKLHDQAFLGISYYSSKGTAEDRAKVMELYQRVICEEPYFGAGFYLLPESDSHGKFTSSPGRQSDYPTDRKEYNATILKSLFS
ncbi:MAG: hypothetical protein DKM50_07820 [Candidatus Margulisiibacteriota bacterium]|nr:MAG: hypothetical protein A2X43_05265 [Candidatus Margulisbacteria bacterium GWD2_39_127]OGI02623.1 MAG: hypothetical protein A2X42_10975 [Candidatus Margulisbacteria bacterium GWF2_38_17]OGI07021.1 MAG: hypothetical protein A2X41_11735 [Candidatus Margulisbacteria bacterium GWE2_39_32]PZM79733.1 MAG: hypothetical protein DKM50_07820 [Candidatus Margulisiibacteriota bacterium]HAR63598.1 hypothetical protein [Candidatus Margulisiibacteriota bacterium]